MDALLDPVRDALGGGQLSLWMIVAGVVAVWLAVRAVKFAVRLAMVALAAALFMGTVPWAGGAAQGAPADCAATAVAETAGGWPSNLTKRVTTEEVSGDATCQDDGSGLASGTAVVRLRSFYDIPFQTWDVDAEGARPRRDLPLN